MTANRKVAIITGSAKGIGAATTEVFVGEGYRVIAVDVLDEGQVLCEKLNAQGEVCHFFKCDVGNESQVRELINKVIDQYEHIDVLVNNAGVVLVKPLDEITWDDYQQVVNTNLGGTFLFCKYVLPVMKEKKRGSIVNVASVSGHVGQIDHVIYGSTKGAIIAFTRALAWELAAYNIRVNSVSPGSVDTPMLRGDIKIESERTGLPYKEVKKKREAEQAFGRWADPSEIAEPIRFLASDSASFITGADLLVDCGWVAK